MAKVYLVRHGENVANLTKEFSIRRIDYSLTAKGRLQAQQTAGYFKDKGIDRIYTSPLKRAIETAQIIGEQLAIQPVVIENLREINVGDLEGMADLDEGWRIHNAVMQAWVDGRPEMRFPGGEDMLEANQRMADVMRQVLEQAPDCHIILVGHGGLFFSSIGVLCQNISVEKLSGRSNQNCSISEIDIDLIDNQLCGSLLCWADISHIYGEAANFVAGYRT